MAQKGFYYNIDNCTGCKTCQVACKDVNNLEAGILFRTVHELETGEYPHPRAFNISMSCNHCENPRCVANCPTGAMYKREEDGIVAHDAGKCIGCQYCVWSCPYGAPKFIPEKGVVGKCTFCLDLVEKGEKPACEASCPMRCIETGDIDELRKKYGVNADMSLLPDSQLTHPSIVINRHRNSR